MTKTSEIYVTRPMIEAWNMELITDAELVYLSVEKSDKCETLAEECVKIKITIELCE